MQNLQAQWFHELCVCVCVNSGMHFVVGDDALPLTKQCIVANVNYVFPIYVVRCISVIAE